MTGTSPRKTLKFILPLLASIVCAPALADGKNKGLFHFEPRFFGNYGLTSFINDDAVNFGDGRGNSTPLYGGGLAAHLSKYNIVEISYHTGHQTFKTSPLVCTEYSSQTSGAQCVTTSRYIPKNVRVKHHIIGIESIITFTDPSQELIPYFRIGTDQWLREQTKSENLVAVNRKEVTQYSVGFGMTWYPLRFIGLAVSQKVLFYQDYLFERESALAPDSYVSGKVLSQDELDYLRQHRTEKKWYVGHALMAGLIIKFD